MECPELWVAQNGGGGGARLIFRAFANLALGATGDAEDGADSSIYAFLSPL